MADNVFFSFLINVIVSYSKRYGFIIAMRKCILFLKLATWPMGLFFTPRM